jgi:hypothetical protein
MLLTLNALSGKALPLSDQDFTFETEFALLDVGATSSMIRTGAVRPTVLVFSHGAGVESIALDWTELHPTHQAFEEARRFARNQETIAYAVILHYSRDHGRVTYHLPGETAPVGSEYLGLSMFDSQGNGRGVSYPIRRAGGTVSYGMPLVADAANADWSPLGDIWGNPFCGGDTVRFRARERAVEPSSPLWSAVVELTRMRIHDDQPNAEDYMAFLDDLRNGIFVVQGRPAEDPGRVLLRPRTVFNPLGVLNVEASRLLLAEESQADLERADQREQVAAL